jgi:5'-deoxynucleotidase YfbR-like HD superfamily hydrolase
MMSRFQQSIWQPNTLLICVGFSFGDKHFKNVIEAAIQSNPSLNLLVYTSDFYKPNFKELLDLTEKQNNIIFINDRFDDLADNYPFSSEYDHSDEE